MCPSLYLVAECALLGANVGDEVAGLFSHLVQEHVAQGQTAVPDVMALHRGERQQQQSEHRQVVAYLIQRLWAPSIMP